MDYDSNNQKGFIDKKGLPVFLGATYNKYLFGGITFV